MDDRLAGVLDKLSEDGNWSKFEVGLNQRTLRVYNWSESVCVWTAQRRMSIGK